MVAERSDHAVSGSTQVGARPGGKALLADAIAGRFDVLLLEGLDRLSRDQVEQESIVRRLEHRGIRIVGASDGYDSTLSSRKIMRGVRGLINEIYLDDLRAKTHRGQTGQVAHGYVAGGKSYGYDLVRSEGGSQYVINPTQADWVVWIFERFSEGASIRSIAWELNSRGVPAPRGNIWAASGIYGSPAKGAGILNNVLYIGKYVWNRSQWVKDPDTGVRRRMDRPRNEWTEVDVPELKIISDQLWQAARLRMDKGRDADGRKAAQRPPTTLLSGVLRCPNCAGPLTARSDKYYGCNRAHDSGPTVCPGFRILRSIADARLLSLVTDDLLSPRAIADFESDLAAALKEAERVDEDDPVADQIAELDQQIEKLVDAVAAVGISPALAARLSAAEAQRDVLKHRVKQSARASVDVDRAIKAARTNLQGLVLNLSDALKKDSASARKAISEILGEVQLEVRDTEVWAHFDADRLALRVATGATTVVAGVGFEPTTFGL
ncbi:MAG: recombinase family protein [Janthinobacterium lividum]